MSEGNTAFLDWFSGVIEEDNSYVVVAEDEAKISGYLYAVEKKIEESWVTHELRSFYLHHISVDPRERKKGIGTLLIEDFKKEATRRKIEHIELEVWDFNESAKIFFQNAGFQIACLRMNINKACEVISRSSASRAYFNSTLEKLKMPILDPTVYIIESTSLEDIQDGRSEGEALSAALRLGGISSEFYKIEDQEGLNDCFKNIGVETNKRKKQKKEDIISIPHIHFSAHGNQDGLALTNNFFIPWAGLKILLLGLGKATGYIGPSGYCLFLVTFSTCNGAYAKKMFKIKSPEDWVKKMFNGKEPRPCIGVVGPNETVEWSDSLTAFITFYHLNLIKSIPAQDAVKIMNKAAGLNGVFECHSYDEN